MKSGLTALHISYVVDPGLVRGLDYYTNTAFEIQYPPLGAQSAICGGGRYDKLVEEMGGPDVPGIGFAVGLERLLLALEGQNLIPNCPQKSSVYIVALGEKAEIEGLKIQGELREKGVMTYMDLQEKSLKGQMKQAGKVQSIYAVIIGENEIEQGKATVKHMQTGEQSEISFSQVADYISQENSINK